MEYLHEIRLHISLLINIHGLQLFLHMFLEISQHPQLAHNLVDVEGTGFQELVGLGVDDVEVYGLVGLDFGVLLAADYGLEGNEFLGHVLTDLLYKDVVVGMGCGFLVVQQLFAS